MLKIVVILSLKMLKCNLFRNFMLAKIVVNHRTNNADDAVEMEHVVA